MLQGPTNILKSHQSSTICKQGTNVAHNVRGGLLIDLTIVAIALLLRYTLSMSLKLTDMYFMTSLWGKNEVEVKF